MDFSNDTFKKPAINGYCVGVTFATSQRLLSWVTRQLKDISPQASLEITRAKDTDISNVGHMGIQLQVDDDRGLEKILFPAAHKVSKVVRCPVTMVSSFGNIDISPEIPVQQQWEIYACSLQTRPSQPVFRKTPEHIFRAGKVLRPDRAGANANRFALGD